MIGESSTPEQTDIKPTTKEARSPRLPTGQLPGGIISKRSEMFKARLSATRSKLEVAKQASMTDELTGLPNRRFFHQELQTRIRERQRSGQDFYLLFMDIDNFKLYNSQYSHAGGDRIIRVFKAVDAITRPREGVIRLAGDEFVQFVDSGITEDELVEVADRDQKAFTENVEKELSEMNPIEGVNPENVLRSGNISIGLVRYQDGMTTESLIELSSKALLKAKITETHRSITETGRDFRELGLAA